MEYPTSGVTVGQLIKQLSIHNPDAEVIFGGDDSLTFYRVKQRGEDLVQIEFEQIVSQGVITDLTKD